MSEQSDNIYINKLINKILSTIDLKPEAGRLYQVLLESGSISAGSLAKLAGLARPSVYDYLKELQAAGLVKQSLRFGVKSFYAAPPDQIGRLLDERLAQIQKQKESFEKILPHLNALGQKSFITPHFQLFEGADGMRQMLMDVLLYRNLETRSFWPIQNALDVVTPEFFRMHNTRRIENNLYVKAIWPARRSVSIKKHPFMGGGDGFCREIRIAPEEIDVTMGYWIYGHKTAILSSTRETIGFIIESAEFAAMMTAQHEVLWNLSKKLAVNPDDVRPFLRDIGYLS